MRLKAFAALASLPIVALLTGCGMGSLNTVSTNVRSAALGGKAYGGQSPIVGATIAVVAVGGNTSGAYGSGATVLATTTTTAGGAFSFPYGAYTCPQDNTPVYILSAGGDSGSGTNNSSVLGAIIGNCVDAPNTYVIINEVTTAGLAYSLSHFFTTSLGGTSPVTDDQFGGPATSFGGVLTYARGVQLAVNYTNNTLVNINAGFANSGGTSSTPNPTTIVTEPAKIYTIANVLAGCVNSTGSTSSTETTTRCGKLFSYTTPPGSTTRPSDTLQAAVQMALYPTQNVSSIYLDTIPPTPAFGGSLSTPPADWSLGIKYTTSILGLGVDTNTVSTIDIDNFGNIWVPSNLNGSVGVSYLDPRTRGFYGPYTTTTMVHPQQVAVDQTGFVWANDSQSETVNAFSIVDPSGVTPASFDMPGTTSSALTIRSDNTVSFGIVDANGYNAIANVDANRAGYTEQNGFVLADLVSSLAADPALGAVDYIYRSTNNRSRSDYTSSPSDTTISVVTPFTTGITGQGAFFGSGYVNNLASAGTTPQDQLCIATGSMQSQPTSSCYAIANAPNHQNRGIAVDGDGALWLAGGADNTVSYAPLVSGSYLTGSTVATNTLSHGTSQGNTLTSPQGVAIDPSGNVWISNAGCTTTGCTPGAFVLTELVGAAAPTNVPVSAAVTGFNGTSTSTATRPTF